MTERGKRNIANGLMIVGLLCLCALYFMHGQRIAWGVFAIGIVMILSGIGIQAFFDLRALKKAKGLKGGREDDDSG
ncbi:hypothetical protein KJ866_02035 [Patescibacteria group bacterium]|nr:hypothetical protein [Patescibacteria group bacterium]MBU2219824.1 hypothetical protein [Patescibacteria group bacterium]